MPHLLQIVSLPVITLRRVIRLTPLHKFSEPPIPRYLTHITSNTERFICNYHSHFILQCVRLVELVFRLGLQGTYLSLVVVLRGHDGGLLLNTSPVPDNIRRVQLRNLQPAAHRVQRCRLLPRAMAARPLPPNDPRPTASLLSARHHVAIMTALLRLHLIDQSLLILPRSALIRPWHQLARARRLREYRHRLVILITYLATPVVRSNILDVHYIRVIRVS